MDYIKIRFVNNPESIDSEFRRTVEEILRTTHPRFSFSRQQWRPQIDIYETREELVILAEIAGVPREEIHLEIGASTVKISGTREGGPREGNARYRLAEIPCGRFERTLSLPVPIDPKTAAAVCRNGLLEIRITKQPADRIQKINIQGS
jgi:HSP20 family protein